MQEAGLTLGNQRDGFIAQASVRISRNA